MQLYVFPPSPRARKPLAVVHHLGLPCEIKLLDLFKGEQKQPEYLKLNPNGRMPTLVDGDFVLWESNAIIQYLADKKPGRLLPSDARGRADAQRWLCWDLAHWDPACSTLLFENFIKGLTGRGAPDPDKIKDGDERFRACAALLDAHLAQRPWMLGEQLSVVDFALAAPLHYAGPGKLPTGGYSHIERWYGQIDKLEAWKKSAPPPLN
jgi:glutathione S-transferase